MKRKKNVCVRVECRCSYATGHNLYPGHIIGIHRTEIGDPRVKINSAWVRDGSHCAGTNTTPCNDSDEECYPRGRVAEIIKVCKVCPHKGQKECPKQGVFI